MLISLFKYNTIILLFYTIILSPIILWITKTLNGFIFIFILIILTMATNAHFHLCRYSLFRLNLFRWLWLNIIYLALIVLLCMPLSKQTDWTPVGQLSDWIFYMVDTIIPRGGMISAIITFYISFQMISMIGIYVWKIIEIIYRLVFREILGHEM